MAKLQPNKIQISQINNGNRYNHGDGVQPSALNAMAEAILYNQENSVSKLEIDQANAEIEQLQIRVTNLEGETLEYSQLSFESTPLSVPNNSSTYAIINRVSGWSEQKENPNSNNLYRGDSEIDVLSSDDIIWFVAPKSGYYSFNCKTENANNLDIVWLQTLSYHNYNEEGQFPFQNIYLSEGEQVTFVFNPMPNDMPLSGHVENIMINYGDTSLPYESPWLDGIFLSKPTSFISKDANENYVDSYVLPQELINKLSGFGITGNYIDFDRKRYVQTKYYENSDLKSLPSPIETDISSYLTDYYNYNFLRVVQGGKINVESTNNSPNVKSMLTFVFKK